MLCAAGCCIALGCFSAESRIVSITRPEAVTGFQANDAAIPPMLETALTRLTGRRSAGEAMATFVSPADVVAIHINTRGKPPLATHPALVDAVIAALSRAGVPGRQIIVWSRNAEEMTAAGYAPGLRANGVRYMAVLPGTGFDREAFYLHENVGELIWGDLEFVGRPPDIDEIVRRAERDEPIDPKAQKMPRQSSNKSYYAKIVTQMATKIINMPVMANSESTGLHGCIASLALDSVDNNRRFQFQPLWGDPALAEIIAEEPIRKKIVLHIMDGLLAQYAGGPSLNINYCHEQATIYVSKDPVAIDATVAILLEKFRATRRLPEAAPMLGHIRSAARLGLGVADVNRIGLDAIGNPPDP